MNNNTEPERDPAVETDYSAEEAKEMGAFLPEAYIFAATSCQVGKPTSLLAVK